MGSIFRHNMSFIIAIDGPSASGKGTIARHLAEQLDFAHLDTGLLYRATGNTMQKQGFDLNDAEKAAQIARTLDVADLMNDTTLRADHVGGLASKVAVHQEVRAALFDFQRQFALHPPGGKAGAILDGRDIGVVICPDAHLKFYLTASTEVRAERRYQEMLKRGLNPEYEILLEDLKQRDIRDSTRTVSPLRPAEDAIIIDSTTRSVEQVFEYIYQIVQNKLPVVRPKN